MDRDMRWHQRGIKEAIWVRAKQPSLKRNGGTRVNLPHAWDRVINDLPRRLTSGGKTLLKVQPQRNNLVKGHRLCPQRRFAPSKKKQVSLDVDLIYTIYSSQMTESIHSLELQCNKSTLYIHIYSTCLTCSRYSLSYPYDPNSFSTCTAMIGPPLEY